MHVLYKVIMVLLASSAATIAAADIYEWTDENGVKHYSNYAPPDGSKVLMKTQEDPYDEAADRARMEAERQERLELARLEIAQREAELELREAEANRKIAEADRVAQDALREADYYREDAENGSRIIYRGGGSWCRDSIWGCTDSRYDRWYYRDKYRHSDYEKYRYKRYNRLRYLSPYQRYRYVQKHYGNPKKDSVRNYRGSTGYGRKRHYEQRRLKSHAGLQYGSSRIGSGSGRHPGRGGLSRGRGGGFGRRR